ncbi:hypothetical protein [Martelella sp. AD-3]|uniref:hypothetical protein n=1 Tax=Martelella sp. AD-3 TaxID=686597 RepID=UPI001268C626|nr:hypothetical protein [Martelella sp. AD-3]
MSFMIGLFSVSWDWLGKLSLADQPHPLTVIAITFSSLARNPQGAGPGESGRGENRPSALT